MERIAISLIRTDGNTQPRAAMNMFLVDDYADDMKTGALFPPVVVFHDGTSYWLADGFHRFSAARQIGPDVLADVRPGSLADAQWHSYSANQDHGLRRTNADKEQAVRRALQHPRAATTSDGQIAQHCGVSQQMVSKYRQELAATHNDCESDTRLGRDGQTINVANIGKGRDVVPAARAMVRGTPIADDPREVHRLAQLAPETQVEIAERIAAGEAASVFGAFRAIQREHGRQVTPLPSGAFQVIYADPPWQYEFAETDTRAIENQYPTMSTEDICRRPFPPEQYFADDAVLFLWATNPKLEEALQVITAWGFTYRTNLVWVKDKIGMGYWARQKHELLLVARRGSFPVPEPVDRPESVIVAPRTEHSQKPDLVYTLIERMYPVARRIEMFARRERPGWVTWGNEIGDSRLPGETCRVPEPGDPPGS